MPKITKPQFEKYLRSLAPIQLLDEMLLLYSKLKTVQEYYEGVLNSDNSETLENYKSKLQKEYMPAKGYGKARSGEARKIVLDFKKISSNQEDIVALILFRTEMMLDFTNAYGDIDEPFYNTLESCFLDACKIIKKNNLQEKFEDKCQILLDKAGDLGWGVPDSMYSIFEEYFEK
jgi:hypothetical protein